MFTVIRVYMRANKKPGETSDERKNILCSDIFLRIPLYSICFDNAMTGGLTTRKRVRKMQ